MMELPALVLNQLLEVSGLRDFVELGGPVLLGVILAGFLLWVLVFEHLLYLWLVWPTDVQQASRRWMDRREWSSWSAQQIRQGLLGNLALRANRPLHLVRTLIALAPLLGLLGTVTGMLEVFDVLAMTVASNPRAMAAGISRATIPTMAGMVLALAGLYVNALLEGWVRRALRHADNLLSTQEGMPHATS
jgi:biopolymer transport protein ExbB